MGECCVGECCVGECCVGECCVGECCVCVHNTGSLQFHLAECSRTPSLPLAVHDYMTLWCVLATGWLSGNTTFKGISNYLSVGCVVWGGGGMGCVFLGEGVWSVCVGGGGGMGCLCWGGRGYGVCVLGGRGYGVCVLGGEGVWGVCVGGEGVWGVLGGRGYGVWDVLCVGGEGGVGRVCWRVYTVVLLPVPNAFHSVPLCEVLEVSYVRRVH